MAGDKLNVKLSQLTFASTLTCWIGERTAEQLKWDIGSASKTAVSADDVSSPVAEI